MTLAKYEDEASRHKDSKDPEGSGSGEGGRGACKDEGEEQRCGREESSQRAAPRAVVGRVSELPSSGQQKAKVPVSR